MYKADKSDIKKIRGILGKALLEDPHTNWYITGTLNKKKPEKKYNFFLDFNIHYALARGEVFISDNDEGCALWTVQKKNDPIRLKVLYLYLLFFFHFGPLETIRILRMQFYFERQHRNESFTHLLYLGVDPDHRNKGVASQLTKPYIEKALAEGLPVYLETANPVNVEIYKKIGFCLYHSWKVPIREDLTVFFMKKERPTESETL